MNALLKKAVQGVEALPQQEQNRLASALLVVIHGFELPNEAEEQEWNDLVTSPKSIEWLDQEMADVKKEIEAGKALDFDPSDLVK